MIGEPFPWRASARSVAALLACLVMGAVPGGAAAQCGNVSHVTFSTYGGSPPGRLALDGTFDPGRCLIELWITPAPLAEPLPVVKRFLLVGTAPAFVALPELGQGRRLLVDPDLFVFEIPPGGHPAFSFRIPPGLPLAPRVLFAQCVNVCFDLDLFQYEFDLTNGLEVGIR